MLRATVFSRCYVFGRALRRVFFRIVYFSLSLCFDNHFSFNFNVSLFFVYCLCFCSNAPSRFDELTDAMLCRPLGDKPLKPIASAVMWIVLPLRFVFFFWPPSTTLLSSPMLLPIKSNGFSRGFLLLLFQCASTEIIVENQFDKTMPPQICSAFFILFVLSERERETTIFYGWR